MKNLHCRLSNETYLVPVSGKIIRLRLLNRKAFVSCQYLYVEQSVFTYMTYIGAKIGCLWHAGKVTMEHFVITKSKPLCTGCSSEYMVSLMASYWPHVLCWPGEWLPVRIPHTLGRQTCCAFATWVMETVFWPSDHDRFNIASSCKGELNLTLNWHECSLHLCASRKWQCTL